jgi:hypothetical protein
MIVYACDVGSIARKRFGWTSSTRGAKGSRDIEELVDEVVKDVKAGNRIAIGFECPLFIPVTVSSKDVGKARVGDGDKAYTAAPGACAAMTGLSELAWVLHEIHEKMPDVKATTSWTAFLGGEASVFVWEAFVSGKKELTDHIRDAFLAVRAFQENQDNLEQASCVSCENPLSFAGAIILWAGMSDDLSLLKTPCVVIRPRNDT